MKEKKQEMPLYMLYLSEEYQDKVRERLTKHMRDNILTYDDVARNSDLSQLAVANFVMKRKKSARFRTVVKLEKYLENDLKKRKKS